MPTEIRGIELTIGATLKDLEARLQEAEAKIKALGQKTDATGQRMTATFKSVGAALGIAFSARAIVQFAQDTLRAAVDFESAFTGVRKTVVASEEGFRALEEGIRSMAKELPASVVEIAGVAEAAGQLGIKSDAILGFTRVMVDLGVTTNLSAEQAAVALARLANITQMPQSEFDRLGSTVVALGNTLETTEADIVEMGLRLASAGEIAGLTEADILGLAGALSSVGINAEAGGTAFSKVIIRITNAAFSGGKELEAFAKVAGVSAADFRKAFETDAAGAIASFVEGLGRIKAEKGNTFQVLDEMGIKEVRLRNALLSTANAGTLLRDSIEMGSRAWRENTALVDEATKRYQTSESQFKIFKNTVNDLQITLGTLLLPALGKLAKSLTSLVNDAAVVTKAFSNLKEAAGNASSGFDGLRINVERLSKDFRDMVAEMLGSRFVEFWDRLNKAASRGTIVFGAELVNAFFDSSKAAGEVVDVTKDLSDTLGHTNTATELFGSTTDGFTLKLKAAAEASKRAAASTVDLGGAADDAAPKVDKITKSVAATAEEVAALQGKLGALVVSGLGLREMPLHVWEDFTAKAERASGSLREVGFSAEEAAAAARKASESLEQSFGERLQGQIANTARLLESEMGRAVTGGFGALIDGDVLGAVQALAPAMGPFGVVLSAAIPLAEKLAAALSQSAKEARQAAREIENAVGILNDFLSGQDVGGGGGGLFGILPEGTFDLDFSALGAGFDAIAEALRGQVEKVFRELEDAFATGEFGTATDLLEAKIAVLQEALARLAVEGYGPNSDAVKAFQAQLEALESEFAEVAARDVFKRLADEMKNIAAEATAAALVGQEFDRARAETDALRQALSDLIALGLDAAHPAVAALLEQLGALSTGSEDLAEALGPVVDPGRGLPLLVETIDTFSTVFDSVMAGIEEQMAAAEEAALLAAALGQNYDLAAAKSRILEEAIRSLAAEYGINDSRVQALIEHYRALNVEMRDFGPVGDLVQDALDKMQEGIRNVNQEFVFFQDEARRTADITRLMQQAMEALADIGTPAALEAFRALEEQLAALKGAADEAADAAGRAATETKRGAEAAGGEGGGAGQDVQVEAEGGTIQVRVTVDPVRVNVEGGGGGGGVVRLGTITLGGDALDALEHIAEETTRIVETLEEGFLASIAATLHASPALTGDLGSRLRIFADAVRGLGGPPIPTPGPIPMPGRAEGPGGGGGVEVRGAMQLTPDGRRGFDAYVLGVITEAARGR